MPIGRYCTKSVKCAFVGPSHGAQRTRYEVQFVLNDEVWRVQSFAGKLIAAHGVARAVEARSSYRCILPKKAPTGPVQGKAANLSTVAMMKQGSRR